MIDARRESERRGQEARSEPEGRKGDGCES